MVWSAGFYPNDKNDKFLTKYVENLLNPKFYPSYLSK